MLQIDLSKAYLEALTNLLDQPQKGKIYRLKKSTILLGKCGVGKSTLINFICDNQIWSFVDDYEVKLIAPKAYAKESSEIKSATQDVNVFRTESLYVADCPGFNEELFNEESCKIDIRNFEKAMKLFEYLSICDMWNTLIVINYLQLIYDTPELAFQILELYYSMTQDMDGKGAMFIITKVPNNETEESIQQKLRALIETQKDHKFYMLWKKLATKQFGIFYAPDHEPDEDFISKPYIKPNLIIKLCENLEFFDKKPQKQFPQAFNVRLNGLFKLVKPLNQSKYSEIHLLQNFMISIQEKSMAIFESVLERVIQDFPENKMQELYRFVGDLFYLIQFFKQGVVRDMLIPKIKGFQYDNIIQEYQLLDRLYEKRDYFPDKFQGILKLFTEIGPKIILMKKMIDLIKQPNNKGKNRQEIQLEAKQQLIQGYKLKIKLDQSVFDVSSKKE